MADRTVDYLLVGGGVAAASCARALRERGAGGEILLVGREADPPYDRPPLSKSYLRGSSSRDEALFAPAGWWDEQRIELLTRTSVLRIDAGARIARLSTREEVAFERALIATGANVRRLRAPGSELEGIHYLRAFGNADAIRADADQAERVVLIGGSYMGCEVAATLAAAGRRCTILMQESVTLEHHFGAEVGGVVQDALVHHGVEIAASDALARFDGDGGRVGAVVTERGRTLPADLVVIGAGVAPDATAARQAGLALGPRGGIACGTTLETSAAGIYAAGDVAEYQSALHGGMAHVEHWDGALSQGRTVARNMVGDGVEHDVVPYFWSDIGDWLTLEYVGVEAGADSIVRGAPGDGGVSAFWLSGGRLTGALSIGRAEELAVARRLIAERAEMSRERLADPSFDLAEL